MADIIIPVSGATFAVVGMSATLSVRVNYAINHLAAAARLSRNVGQIKANNDTTRFGDWWIDMRDNAVSCLFLTSACLEAYANELFADRDKVFPNIPPHAVEKVWQLSERGPPISKLNIALDLLQKPKLDMASDLLKNISAVITLRNALTHFKPEWSHERDKHVKISDVLRNRFDYNQHLFQAEDIFPQAWIGHGCTQWAVDTTTNFLKHFESLAGLDDRTSWSAYGTQLTP
jgi:hypothetical protein